LSKQEWGGEKEFILEKLDVKGEHPTALMKNMFMYKGNLLPSKCEAETKLKLT
jgi:hypothetical protein